MNMLRWRLILVCLVWLCCAGNAWSAVIVDQAGRNVTVPDAPQRIVTLAPNLTELAFALDAGSLVVGRSSCSNFPEEAAAIQTVGSYFRPNLERIIALHPDVCFAMRDGTPLELVQRLERLGIPVVVLNPHSLATLEESVLLMGKVLHKQAQAQARVAVLNERLARLTRLLGVVVPEAAPVVLFQVQKDPLIVAGEGTYLDELIQRAGGANFAAGHSGYPRISMEEILRHQPDVLIVSEAGRERSVSDKELSDPRLAGLLTRTRVYHVNPDIFTRPSLRNIEAIEELAQWLYPNLALGESAKAQESDGRQEHGL